MRIYTRCADPGCDDPLLWLSPRATTHAGCTDPHADLLQTERAFLAAAETGDDTRADELLATLDAAEAAASQQPPRLAEAAEWYASWGWRVFPLQPEGKEPLPGSHGFKDATTDRDRIRAWWRTHPRANIGVPTGVCFDALDVDFPRAAPVWPELRESDAMPTVHGISLTAHGGLHVLLQPTGGGNFADAARARLAGLDYRGRGGYIVVPPSRLADGRYAWHAKPSPHITPGDRRRQQQ